MDIYSEITTADKCLRKAIYFAFNGNCFYTGRYVNFDDMHIDHIRPKNKGGKNCIANYVLSCQEINFKKHNKYSDRFGKVILEITLLLFAPKVLEIYKELLMNDPTLIKINTFMRKKNIKEKSETWNRMRSTVQWKYHNIRHKHPTKNRVVLFSIDDLEKILKEIKQTKPNPAQLWENCRKKI